MLSVETCVQGPELGSQSPLKVDMVVLTCNLSTSMARWEGVIGESLLASFRAL